MLLLLDVVFVFTGVFFFAEAFLFTGVFFFTGVLDLGFDFGFDFVALVATAGESCPFGYHHGSQMYTNE